MTKHVSFVLFPGFQMLAYALAVETLASANRAAGDALFTWDTRITGHKPTSASNGAEMTPDRTDWDDADKVDLAVVIAADTVPPRIPNGFRAFVEGVAAKGGMLAGLDTGSLVLAMMGQLSGRTAVIYAGADAEAPTEFPDITLSDRAFALDDGRLTSAGGTAPSTAMQAWIAGVATPALSATTSQAMAKGQISGAAGDMTDEVSADPVIAEMEEHMRANLAAPLSLVDLAGKLGLTRKALRGRCIRVLGMRPSDRYLALRLAHGTDLLRNTAMPIADIAEAAGFGTAAGFSRSVRQQMGVSPSAVRKMARAARMVSAYA